MARRFEDCQGATMPTLEHLVEGFELLFQNLLDPEFAKTMGFQHWSEQEIDPLVRTYLLGRYEKQVRCQVKTPLPGSNSGFGRLDFVVGSVGIELACRREADGKALLGRYINKTEVVKLLKHNGLALLVLFDFSKSPYSKDDLNGYREWSLGKGNHKVSPFNVVYFAKGQSRIEMNVRVQ